MFPNIWFGFVNGDIVQLQGMLFALFKMTLAPKLFINSLWLNVFDRIILVNAYIAEIFFVIMNCLGTFCSTN